MRYTFCLALFATSCALMAGCGGTTEQTAQNTGGEAAASGTPNLGGPGAGGQSGAPVGQGGQYSSGYDDEPMGAGAGTGGGSMSGGPPPGYDPNGAGAPPGYNPGGGDPNANGVDPSQYGGPPPGYDPSGGDPQGYNPNGGDPSQSGFDPSQYGGPPPGYNPNGADPSLGGGADDPIGAGANAGAPAGGGPGASAPSPPPPPGGNTGGGGGTGGPGASAPSPPPPPGGNTGGGGGAGGPGASAPAAPPAPGGGGLDDPIGGGGQGYPGGDPYGGQYSGGQYGQPQAEPKTLKEKAEFAFAQGKEDDAFQYMYAYYLTEVQGARDHQLRLLPSTNEPATAVRIGVGVTYSAPNNFSSQPPRIGDRPVINERGNNQFGGGGGQYGGGDPGAPAGFGGGGGGGSSNGGFLGKLEYYIGDFGERLVDRLDQRRTFDDGETIGFYGSFLVNLDKGNGGNVGGGFGGYGGGYPGGDGYNDEPTGAGAGGGGGAPPVGGGGGGGRGLPADGAKGQLLPGVMYIGEGSKADLMKTARAHGLDALIHFEVRVSVARRTGTESTSVKSLLYDVKSGSQLYSQRRTITNISVWRDREKDASEENDPIEVELDSLVTATMDENFRLTDLPQLDGEQAQARVDELSKKHDNPLPVLTEIMYYYRQSLIDEEAATKAFNAIIGSGGADLAKGSPEQKLAAIEKWMPGNFKIQEEGGGGRDFR